MNIPRIGLHKSGEPGTGEGRFTIGSFQDNIRQAPVRTTLHRHDFHELAIFEKGTGSYHGDFQAHAIKTPCALLIPAGQVHEWPDARKLRGKIIAFDFEFLGISSRHSTAASLFRPPAPTLIPLDNDQVKTLSHTTGRISDESQQNTPVSREITRSLLTVLLLDFYRIYDAQHNQPETAADKLTSDFIQLLEDSWSTAPTAKFLAGKLGVSPDHLSAVLRRTTGHSVLALIQERTMLEAKRLLAHSRQSISEIAYSCGFQDPSYFTRLFKKYCGKTPSQFREVYWS